MKCLITRQYAIFHVNYQIINRKNPIKSHKYYKNSLQIMFHIKHISRNPDKSGMKHISRSLFCLVFLFDKFLQMAEGYIIVFERSFFVLTSDFQFNLFDKVFKTLYQAIGIRAYTKHLVFDGKGAYRLIPVSQILAGYFCIA